MAALISDFKIGSLARIDGHTYIIEKTIQGGMGLIVLCSATVEQGSLVYRQSLASKVFFPNQNIRQIRSELQVWQGLHHPHIATLLAIGHLNDWLCACMPWFRDGSASVDTFAAKGGLSTLRSMLAQIIDALEYAFEKHKVLHLDIKPANILSQGRDFFLADWGIAKLSALKAINKEPSSGGTLPYMAPERFIQEPFSAVADIYSLGISTLELLTGSIPLTETSTDDMVAAIISGRCDARIRSLVETIPPNWRELVLKCSAYHPDNRPQSYTQLRRLVERLEN